MAKTPVWMNAEDAVKHVRSGMSIAFPHLSAEPTALTSALWQHAETIENITVVSGMLLSGYKFLSMPCAKNINFKTWFLPGSLLRKTAGDVKAEYLPMTWAQTARFLNETSFDVGMIHVSPADEQGFHSFGVSCTATKGIANSAKFLIAQVNPHMPRTLGDASIHRSKIDILVDAPEALIEYPNRPLDDIDAEIGRLIAQMIPDGASLSLGVGGIPLAAANALIEKGARDLRFINTFTDPTVNLIEAGCATKDNPKAHTGDIFGSQALYDWVANNEAIALADALTTHTPESFVARKTVVSVNSALEIDLIGQVNAETIGGKQTGSMGGLIDFAVGGQVEGGRFILGLRSQTNSGRPRIVKQLDGHIVSLSRTFVETVVTEYGVANLRNLTVRERALALADIAHPDDRESLRTAASELI